MSGHNKWSTIKRRKGAEDAKRGKIFTRIARDIAQSAREGGGDENTNARLKLSIQKAKAANMPKDNIERAILRGLGKLEGAVEEETTYEGYGPDGVAYLVETVSDNKNRTLAEIKHAFNRGGGSMASAGSVAWQFEQKGYITLTGDKLDFDEVFMVAAEAGADDVVAEEDMLIVYTPREQLAAVETVLTDAGYQVEDSELRWEAKNEVDLPVDKSMANMRLMSNLEDLEDVQSVASNLNISDEVIAAYETA